jgi:hypothetical protein
MRKGTECFSCGQPMSVTFADGGWCPRCEVLEIREENYVSWTLTVPGDPVWGVTFLDHSAGHYPSPA